MSTRRRKNVYKKIFTRLTRDVLLNSCGSTELFIFLPLPYFKWKKTFVQIYVYFTTLNVTSLEVSDEEYTMLKNLEDRVILRQNVYFQSHIMNQAINLSYCWNSHTSIFVNFFFKEGKVKVRKAEKESPRDHISLCSPISFCREVLRDKFLSSETAVFFTAGWLTCSIVRILGRPFAFRTTVWATENGICYKGIWQECVITMNV